MISMGTIVRNENDDGRRSENDNVDVIVDQRREL